MSAHKTGDRVQNLFIMMGPVM